MSLNQEGAEVNAITNGGATPLHRAAHQVLSFDCLRKYSRVVDLHIDAVVNRDT